MRVVFVKLSEKKEPSHKWRTNYNMSNFEYVNENLVIGVEKRYEQNQKTKNEVKNKRRVPERKSK